MAGDEEKNTKGPAPFEVANPAILEMIGTRPDAEVAREFEIHPITVRAIRDRNGLTETRGRKLTEEKQPEILDAIGKKPDTEVAKEFGVSTATVVAIRKRHGVEPAPPETLQLSPDPEEGLVVRINWIMVGGLISALIDRNGISVLQKDHPMAQELHLFNSWPECEAFAETGDGPCLLPLRVARSIFSGMPFSFQDGASVPATKATA